MKKRHKRGSSGKRAGTTRGVTPQLNILSWMFDATSERDLNVIKRHVNTRFGVQSEAAAELRHMIGMLRARLRRNAEDLKLLRALKKGEKGGSCSWKRPPLPSDEADPIVEDDDDD